MIRNALPVRNNARSDYLQLYLGYGRFANWGAIMSASRPHVLVLSALFDQASKQPPTPEEMASLLYVVSDDLLRNFKNITDRKQERNPDVRDYHAVYDKLHNSILAHIMSGMSDDKPDETPEVRARFWLGVLKEALEKRDMFTASILNDAMKPIMAQMPESVRADYQALSERYARDSSAIVQRVKQQKESEGLFFTPEKYQASPFIFPLFSDSIDAYFAGTKDAIAMNAEARDILTELNKLSEASLQKVHQWSKATPIQIDLIMNEFAEHGVKIDVPANRKIEPKVFVEEYVAKAYFRKRDINTKEALVSAMESAAQIVTTMQREMAFVEAQVRKMQSWERPTPNLTSAQQASMREFAARLKADPMEAIMRAGDTIRAEQASTAKTIHERTINTKFRDESNSVKVIAAQATLDAKKMKYDSLVSKFVKKHTPKNAKGKDKKTAKSEFLDAIVSQLNQPFRLHRDDVYSAVQALKELRDDPGKAKLLDSSTRKELDAIITALEECKTAAEKLGRAYSSDEVYNLVFEANKPAIVKIVELQPEAPSLDRQRVGAVIDRTIPDDLNKQKDRIILTTEPIQANKSDAPKTNPVNTVKDALQTLSGAIKPDTIRKINDALGKVSKKWDELSALESTLKSKNKQPSTLDGCRIKVRDSVVKLFEILQAIEKNNQIQNKDVMRAIIMRQFDNQILRLNYDLTRGQVGWTQQEQKLIGYVDRAMKEQTSQFKKVTDLQLNSRLGQVERAMLQQCGMYLLDPSQTKLPNLGVAQPTVSAAPLARSTSQTVVPQTPLATTAPQQVDASSERLSTEPKARTGGSSRDQSHYRSVNRQRLFEEFAERERADRASQRANPGTQPSSDKGDAPPESPRFGKK